MHGGVFVDGSSLLSCSRDDVLSVIDMRMNRVIKTLRSDMLTLHVTVDFIVRSDNSFIVSRHINIVHRLNTHQKYVFK